MLTALRMLTASLMRDLRSTTATVQQGLSAMAFWNVSQFPRLVTFVTTAGSSRHAHLTTGKNILKTSVKLEFI